MSGNEKRRRFFTKLKNKYRLTIYNDTTLEQVWHMRISRLTVLSFFVPVLLLLIGSIVVLIAFTPLREFIPGYPDEKTRREIVYNALKVDSLDNVVKTWDVYFESINNIMLGKDPSLIQNMPPDTMLGREGRESLFQVKDSLFRAQIEYEEQFNLAVSDVRKGTFENLVFFPPVKGEVTGPFSSADSHFGIDIATTPSSAISATLAGSVTVAYWTIDDGYTIIIQHADNLISIYKQAARLLKKPGDRVTSGEPIGFTGLPANKSDRVDVHFELWHNGAPINPAIYIAF